MCGCAPGCCRRRGARAARPEGRWFGVSFALQENGVLLLPAFAEVLAVFVGKCLLCCRRAEGFGCFELFSTITGQLVGSGGAALQFLRALSDLGMYLMQQVLLSLMPAYSEETADCLEMPLKTLWLKFLPCLYLRVVVLHAVLLQHPSPLVQEQPLGSASQNFPSPAVARAAASCVSRRASTNSTGIVCFHHF